jgi:hypothetical protein
MDIPMPELQGSDIREQSGDRRRRETAEVDVVLRTETEKLLQLGNVTEAEASLQKWQDALDEMKKQVRAKRQGIEASRCAICRKGFDRGRPYGNEKLRKPGEEALDVYACSASCFSKLQQQCEQLRLQLYDEDFRASRMGKAEPEDPRKRRRVVHAQTPI